jgi:hypothetical protein
MKLPAGAVSSIALACLHNLPWIQLNAATTRISDDAEIPLRERQHYHALERGDSIAFWRDASQVSREGVAYGHA